MKLIIDNKQDMIEYNEELEKVLIDACEAALKAEGITVETEISMILIDNSEIKSLNNQFRGIDRETDVLSFPLINMDDEDGINNSGEFNNLINDNSAVDMNEEALLLGDIALSLEKAEEQSIEYGHSFYREVAYLTVHSMLHLLGYDHMEEEEKKVMRGREEAIMSDLGLVRGE